jgi:hypothetical protein
MYVYSQLILEWGYKHWHMAVGAVLGIVSAAICIFTAFLITCSRHAFHKMKSIVAKLPILPHIIPPTLAGYMIGAVNFHIPMTLGYGPMVIEPLIVYGGVQDLLPMRVLVSTMFGRIATLGKEMIIYTNVWMYISMCLYVHICIHMHERMKANR